MPRRLLALLLLLGLALVAPEVRANYTEAHVSGEDVHVTVERDGSAVVTHVVSYRVLAGTLRSIALVGFADDLRFRPTATVTSSDGHVVGASVVRDDKDLVHVTVDDPKGLKRGDYRFELVYETTLAGRVVRDGAFDRVRFALPAMHEGVDGARVVLDLPSAPTEPRADQAAPEAEADLSTLRRTAERDELELVRPHVPKGEAATFFARIDPKAIAQMPGAVPREPEMAPAAPAPAEKPPIARALVVAAAALALFALALAKGRLLPESARGLVPLPAAARAVLAAAIFGAGVYTEAAGRITVGAAVVAAALPLLAWRILEPPAAPRGPASWLVLAPEEAFARVRSRADVLDATTSRGAIVLAAFALAAALACRLAQAAGGAAPYLVAIDALAIIPIFLTGTSRQMPPSAAREGEALAPIARALEGDDAVKVAPLARLAPGGAPSEIRVLVSPRCAMAGVLAVEIGVAWQRTVGALGGASLPSFDVLVRVQDGTFASQKMAAAFPKMRALPGRKPEERVFRFEPEGPSASSAAELARSLAETLRDRRLVTAPPVEGRERRLPPNARRTAVAAQQAAA